MHEPSESLMELIFLALDHGIDCVKEEGSLIAFLIEESQDRTLHRFVTDRIEAGLVKAQQFAGSLDANTKKYAIGYDGYITIEGTKYDAILVEAAERGAPTGFRFAQRYRPKKGLFSRFKIIGNAAFLGEAEQRFSQTGG
jgi:hypothetical protein